MKNLLEVKNLNIDFETTGGYYQAIRHLSFELQQGKTLGVVGESGCGKSITNLALMGLLPPNARLSAEQIHFAGHDLLSFKEKYWQKLRGGEIAIIFQDPMSALNPSLRVGFQIDEALRVHHPQKQTSWRQERVLQLLDQVGIPDPGERAKAYAHELSGGMAQRVMIAMALAGNPKLLIADEPTTALDVTIQGQILSLLKQIQRENQMALIFVTHDLAVVANMADHIQVMYAGEIVEKGKAQEMIQSPRHPYTEGLLKSLPGYSSNTFRQKLFSISGLVPDLSRRSLGCPFAPRCPYVVEKCRENLPPLANDNDNNNDRLVRCFFPHEEGEKP